MSKIFEKLKALKHKEIIIAVIAVVVMLFIYFSTFSGEKETKAESKSDYCERMESSLALAISHIEGAGKADVVINWSSSVEIVTATNTNSNGNSSSSQVVNGTNGPIIVKEIYPKALGVLIVCEGGNNAKIKVDVVMAVSALMDISAEKVLVLGMNK